MTVIMMILALLFDACQAATAHHMEVSSTMATMTTVFIGGGIAPVRKNRKAKMTPTPETTTTTEQPKAEPKPETKTVQETVFDLTTFADVKLSKDITMPKMVTSIEEAQSAVANNKDLFLKVFYTGLCELEIERQKAERAGWKVVDADGELSKDDYTGVFADADKTKLINAAILNSAKAMVNPGESWENQSKETKRALKSEAMEFMRGNPKYIARLAGLMIPSPTESK